MSLKHGGSIVRDGLIFGYDLDNVKSFKGAPVTNLLTGAGTTNLANGAILSGSATRTDLGNGFVKFEVTAQITYRMYCNLATLTNGQTYGCSVKYKDNTCTTLAMDWCDTSVTGGVNTPSGDNGIIYGSGTRGTYDSTYRFLDINIGIGSVTLYEAQVDSVSVPTPYVNGTRSNTASVLDQFGDSTITVNSITPEVNNKVSFDGTDYITVPSANLKPTITITQECWFRSTTTGTSQVMIGLQYGTSTSNSYALWWTNTQWATGINVGGTFYQLTNNTHPRATNTWYHFASTYDGANIKMYVDGEEIDSVARSGLIGYDASNTLVTLGADFNGAGYNSGVTTHIQGELPVVKIYNRALTATEIKQNFQALRSRFGL